MTDFDEEKCKFNVSRPTELPIHMTIVRCAPPMVVDAVLSAHPAAIDAALDTSDGSTPMHLLAGMQRDATDADTLRLFVRRFPPPVQFFVRSLRLPEDVAEIILSYVPHPAERTSDDGETPLNLLCGQNLTEISPSGSDDDNLIRILASAAPRALGIPNNDGMLPLLSLLLNPSGGYCSLALFLVSLTRPSDLAMQDKRYRATPLSAACGRREDARSSDVVLTLLRSQPAAAAQKDSTRMHFPLWRYLASAFEGGDWEKNATECDRRVLAELAEAAPEALTEVAPLELLLPNVEEYFLEGTKRNIISYFRTFPFCNWYPDLRDIFSCVLEAHPDSSKRRRFC